MSYDWIGFRDEPSAEKFDDRVPWRHHLHSNPAALGTQGGFTAPQNADKVKIHF